MTSSASAHFLETASVPASAANRVDRPSTMVICGATGDLTARKLMPALFELHGRKLLPPSLSIVGMARRDLSDADFRGAMHRAVNDHARTEPVSPDAWSTFAGALHYQQVPFADPAAYSNLAKRLDLLESTRSRAADSERPQRIFYLATSPSFFETIIEQLGRADLVDPLGDAADVRVVIEKPFGQDLASAMALSESINRFLHEDQIYRIDHYLGKETVQNILSFRFGNAIFEPLFNNQYVDHVQITVAESIGMEGRRGGYYDQAGALRDIIQNHGLQLLCLVAMEPPAVFGPKEIQDEKVKVLRALKPIDPERDVVRGQYLAGVIDGESVAAYRQEAGVDPKSQTETYVALRVGIDNWRWAGVPFMIRTGKCLAKRATEIAIQFRQPPMHFFSTVECVGDVCDIRQAKPNLLVFRIQPNEGISLSFSAKRPGMQFQIHPAEMDFDYDETFPTALSEAYERLLLDVLRGDSTLFTRIDEVESAWGFLDPVLQADAEKRLTTHPYEAGTWGPGEADALFHGCDGRWRSP